MLRPFARLSFFLLTGPLTVWGQCYQPYGICSTLASAEIDTVRTTNVTQQVNTYSTEIKARFNGGAYLYDQTFAVAYTDPTVLAAITAAKATLTDHGAVTFAGPTLLSNNQATISSSNTVQNGIIGTVVNTLGYAFNGPTTVSTGDHGICQSITLPMEPNWYIVFVGCTKQGVDVAVGFNTDDFDTLTITAITLGQTTTTTNTTLTTQVYELDGSPAIPSAPAPESLILLLTGLASIGWWLGRKPAAG